MEINSKPEELDVLDRKIMQLEIEIEAIKREKDERKICQRQNWEWIWFRFSQFERR